MMQKEYKKDAIRSSIQGSNLSPIPDNDNFCVDSEQLVQDSLNETGFSVRKNSLNLKVITSPKDLSHAGITEMIQESQEEDENDPGGYSPIVNIFRGNQTSMHKDVLRVSNIIEMAKQTGKDRA